MNCNVDYIFEDFDVDRYLLASSCIMHLPKCEKAEEAVTMVAIQPTYWPLGPKLTVAHHSPTQHHLLRFVARHTEKFQNNRSKA